jgi:hypothetical protein
VTRQDGSSGDAGYRSRYLSHAKRALFHLSYTPREISVDELPHDVLSPISITLTVKQFKQNLELLLCHHSAESALFEFVNNISCHQEWIILRSSMPVMSKVLLLQRTLNPTLVWTSDYSFHSEETNGDCSSLTKKQAS